MKMFLNWIKTIFERIGRLVVEVISVKIVIMLVITKIYLDVSSQVGVIGFTLVIVGWLTVLGLRFTARYANLLKQVKEP